MRDYFTINDKSSGDFHLYVANKNQFAGGARKIETIEIPGRNGTLSIDDGTFQNVDITYEMYGSGDVRANVAAFRDYLGSLAGYVRLEDTFDPDIYLKARYSEPFDVNGSDRRNVSFDITFDCDPRKFLKSGEEIITVTSSTSIKNPTYGIAKPLIRAYGTGTFTINDISVQVTTASTYTDIDCDMQEAYKGTTNCNGNIVLSNGKFPEFKNGSNNITLSGFSRLEITPNWWRR